MSEDIFSTDVNQTPPRAPWLQKLGARSLSYWVCWGRPADLAAGEVAPSTTKREGEERERPAGPAPLAWCTRAFVCVHSASVRTLRTSAHPAHSLRTRRTPCAFTRRARLTRRTSCASDPTHPLRSAFFLSDILFPVGHFVPNHKLPAVVLNIVLDRQPALRLAGHAPRMSRQTPISMSSESDSPTADRCHDHFCL